MEERAMNRAAILALALGLTGTPAMAQTSALDTDIKCLVASAYLGSVREEPTRTLAAMGGIYFMGRISARAISDTELEERATTAAKAMPPSQQRAILTECAVLMREAGQKLRTLGENVKARETARP
jgi:hypothetical protein